MTIHALDKNLVIKSVPVSYRDRPEGSFSKLNTYTDGIKVLLTIFNLYRDYKPIKFFGVLALLLAIVSVGMFIPVFVEYVNTGYVPRIPTLIISGFSMVAAIMSFMCGLILDTNAKNSCKNLEIQMNLIHLLLKNEKK